MIKKVIIVFGLIIFILTIEFVILRQEKEGKGGISFEEQQSIEAWIIEIDLNQYGDPKDTVYTGGTPLFDERTGERVDRYEYVLRKHPDRPWRK